MTRLEDFWNYEMTKSVFNNLDIGVHVIDEDGITVLYNSICQRMDENNEKNIIGKNMKELVDQGIFSKSIGIEALEKHEKVADSQVVNGKVIFANGIPIFDSEHKIKGVIISCMDISKLDHMQNQLDAMKRANQDLIHELAINSTKIMEDDVIISRSKVMEDIKCLARRIAIVDSTVLIEGDSGVGKGLLSEYIHKNSLRKDGPFIKINCATFPENLIESELFGYEPGSFTGASKLGKIGLIELSNHGTLFLDEIGELPLSLQVKLLNVIQDKIINRIGSTEQIKVDARIIAATNQNLKSLVKKGTFRADLYYRLNVIPIEIPPLNQRKVDIIPLTKLFLDKINSRYGLNREISPSAIKILLSYNWPGNVRELENEIERLVVTCQGVVINAQDVQKDLYGDTPFFSFNKEQKFKENISAFEAILMQEYMHESDNINHMSELTGFDPSTIRKKSKKLNFDLFFDGK